MQIRKLEPADVERLEAFLRETPEDDRTFFKEDLTDRETLHAIASDQRTLGFVAVDENDRIIGYVRVLPGTGLMSHVGEVRLVVAPTNRRSGVGRDLARHALVESVKQLKLRKLFVEVVAEQDPAIRMFKKMGFTPEALLRDHLRDRKGTMRDLVLLAHFVEDNWSGLESLGVGREVR
jgi:ribosomal protein S18 acetylase RimI-like enzyme